MISCVFKVVEMADDESAWFIMEQIIAGNDIGSNLPIMYTDEEGNQVDMFLNMSGDGNVEPEPQQNLAVAEGTDEVYIIYNVLPHLECLFHYYYVLINES